VRIRSLQPNDDRTTFRCGDADYDDFLSKYAGQNMFKHRVGSTIVAVEDERVLGYATISPGHVEIDELSDSDVGRLPRYPVPVLRLARLAVDERVRGLGLGGLLVREVLATAVRMRDELGCVAVVADVLESRVEFYEALGFKRMRILRGRPRVAGTVSMYLALRRVERSRLLGQP
jgi:predicted N-acetyltransferase YhbS